MNSAEYIELEQELVDKGFVQDPVVNGYLSPPVSLARSGCLKLCVTQCIQRKEILP